MSNSDLLIMGALDNTGQVPVELSLATDNVSYSTIGIQKAAQQWMCLFLTRTGSALSDPSYGTNFLAGLQGSNLFDELEVQAKFNEAVRDSLKWLNKNTTRTRDDEIITKVELINLIMAQDSVQLYVHITTRAGETRTYTTPTAYLNR